MLNRKTKASETKKKIYQSAHQLFEKYGFDNVSVDTIVEAAGVSKGSFYVHFGSKSTLIATMTTDVVAELDLNYKSYLSSFPSDTAASKVLSSLAEKIADIIADTLGYDQMKVIYEALITRTINSDFIIGYNREIYNIFRNIIDYGVQQGEFKTELSVDTVTNHCIMSLRGLTYEWCIRYPDFNLKDQVKTHFEMLLTGIKK